MDKIEGLYEKLRQLYVPATVGVLDDLFGGKPIDTPKAMFPPEEGKSFDYRQAEAGFLQHDCATLTAYRATRTEAENEEMNRRLVADMQADRLDFIPVDGCFREAHEAEASHEASFFVYDKKGEHDSLAFFRKIFQLSENYGQDSFLFKCAGLNRTAFLISTNSDSREQDGDIKLAGRLYFNLPPVGPYTTLGEGRFTFVPEAEPERKKPEPPSRPKAKPQAVRISEKRFTKPAAKDIVLSPEGEVRIGRYTIGRWQKADAYEAQLLRRRQPVTGDRMSDLRTAIAAACKRGVTGKYKG